MNQTLELIFRKTISVKCLDEPNTGIDFPENDFRDSQTAENIFLFRKLAFPENMYFLENILQQPNAPLGCVWIGSKSFPEIIFCKTRVFGCYGK